MKHVLLYITFITFFNLDVYSQNDKQYLEGSVSFVTSKNIYVKFKTTKNIEIGDLLYKLDKKTACLTVTSKSSYSVVCSIVNDCILKKNDLVYHSHTPKEIEKEVEDIGVENKTDIKEKTRKDEGSEKKSSYTQKIKARLSASSYSYLSDVSNDRHRLMSRFSLNANHIGNTRFSVDSYLNYRQNIDAEFENTSNTKQYIFRVYTMSLKYTIDTAFTLALGRKTNHKTSSLGAIDGLQAEKHIGKNYIGILGGFRPDFTDYGFNSDLLQYGGYIGRESVSKKTRSQTTLGFAEQRNTGEIDRRYLFLQHSSTFFKKLRLFSSMQLDMYSKVNGTISNDIRPTNLYFSLKYKFYKNANIRLSYDSRKRVLYFKTYQTIIDRLLDDDLARQGVRARLNFKPFKYVSTGVSYSKRFQSDYDNKSDNIYGYLSFSKIPEVGGRLSLSYNINTSNYAESNVASVRYSRSMLKNKLNTEFYYRYADYNYLTMDHNINQNYYGAIFSFFINKSLSLGIFGELTTYDQNTNYRINTRIIKRFKK